jgi:hypothetical protein
MAKKAILAVLCSVMAALTLSQNGPPPQQAREQYRTYDHSSFPTLLPPCFAYDMRATWRICLSDSFSVDGKCSVNGVPPALNYCTCRDRVVHPDKRHPEQRREGEKGSSAGRISKERRARYYADNGSMVEPPFVAPGNFLRQ